MAKHRKEDKNINKVQKVEAPILDGNKSRLRIPGYISGSKQNKHSQENE